MDVAVNLTVIVCSADCDTAYGISSLNHRLSVSSISSQGVAVGTLSGYAEPGDVVTFNVRRPEVNKLTDVNGDVLLGRQLGEVEEIWYPSVDGQEIQGWIIKPPDFDPTKQYPLILAIHGGPHGMYGVGFNFAWQNHAANGYVVLYTNPRGSSGYGSTFGNAIKRAYPGMDYDDLMTGVDTVINRGYIDSDNLLKRQWADLVGLYQREIRDYVGSMLPR